MRNILLVIVLALYSCQPNVNWPEQTTEAKPGARWWWMGSAVDESNLTKNMEAYADAGIGSLEITPIYGIQGNDSNEVDFLSERWMELYRHTVKEGERLGINIDLNTGTGWPFGGPDVDISDAASRLLVKEYKVSANEQVNLNIVPDEKKQQETSKLACLIACSNDGQTIDLTARVKEQTLNWNAPQGNWRLIALFEGNTFQKVKRAAPGGKGLVLNHFSKPSVTKYLSKFTNAFHDHNAPVPHNFFNDSYEVYKADWTPGLLQSFEDKYGYKIQDYLPLFLSQERNDTIARIISDYRELLSNLLLNNFTIPWTEWAHGLNSKTRNQAHGSPGNLIDIYAAVDIPECEGFGLSDFNIKGLRKDSMTRHNDSDLSMLKYASSAAHISGKKYTSSETFTWLTEHFRTSFSQCKPDLDLMFVSGVNHMNFHGTTYSPQEAAWPGWKFYASIDMSPTNSLWRDAKPFCDYISRVQSFLQMGKPDNDFLVYLPVYDLWHEQEGRLLMFDIHKMEDRAPEFIDVVHRISEEGYDMDYISDSFIRTTEVKNNLLVTSGGSSYKAIIIPSVDKMPADVLNKLLDLANKGAKIVFLDNYPSDVPGFAKLSERRKDFSASLSKLPKVNFENNTSSTLGKGQIITGTVENNVLHKTGVIAEEIKTVAKLNFIRRQNEEGFHYFISALKGEDTDMWINLTETVESVLFFNPLNGKIGNASIKNTDGKTKVRIQLKSGESVIMKTYNNKKISIDPWPYIQESGNPFILKNNWKLTFKESIPAIADTFLLPQLIPWTQLENEVAKENMGTAVYSTSFSVNKQNANEWLLDLGDVRETARVIINGQYVQTLWSVPYRLFIGDYLKNGLNSIDIEVTGLPANHISSLDKKGVEWRIFKEINFVDLNYKKTGYAHWETMPAGLNSQVKLIPLNLNN
ncbi:alpha-L-rhamnosidase [Plebeiibacterium marinum]|uniref:Glycosyl hydrolase n=1 Tax=Plebeiibacterium marinum TaxID=2992111 RepID=A0AAE3MG48_9BACT|nr:glycosyl hydrolase [Plebeiobacterium marinum]MCW3806939.1 glycosyl hydrolase [Plebeiobacterium marinum]